jgi:hypothetical protein
VSTTKTWPANSLVQATGLQQHMRHHCSTTTHQAVYQLATVLPYGAVGTVMNYWTTYHATEDIPTYLHMYKPGSIQANVRMQQDDRPTYTPVYIGTENCISCCQRPV